MLIVAQHDEDSAELSQEPEPMKDDGEYEFPINSCVPIFKKEFAI